MPLFPACHRENLGRRGGSSKHFLGPRQIERRQRSIKMKIERRLGSCLTVTQPGELFAISEEKLNLEARGLQLDQLATIQFQLGRGQDDVTRLVGLFPIDEDHHAQLPLARNVPDKGRGEMHV